MAINSRSLGSASAYSTGTVAIDSTGFIVTLTNGIFTNRWGQGDSLIVKPTNPFSPGFSNGFSRQVLGIVAKRTSPTKLTLANSLTSLTGQSGLAYKIQRSYSTFNSWIIDRGGTLDFVTDTRTEKAVIYNDGIVYDESITLPQTNTSSSYYWWLYVPKSQRHNGSINGRGATLNYSGGASYTIAFSLGVNHGPIADYTVIDGLKFIRNASNWAYGNTLGIYSNNCEVKNCLFYCPSGIGSIGSALVWTGSGYYGWSNGNYFHDNIIICDSTSFEYGMIHSFAWVTDTNKIYNNTFYGSYTIAGLSLSEYNGSTNAIVKNNYVCNIGTGVDYQFLNSYTSSFSGFAYNASDDGSAGTANNNKTISLSARKFINTTAGGQLLYILSNSSLLNAGIGPQSDSSVASTSIDWSSRTGSSARIGAAQWQLIIGSTIGTSATRDFSTINSWLAACPVDLTAVQHQWVGYCYKDSEFVQNVSIAGIATSTAYGITLTSPIGQRHTGREGTGVVLNNFASNTDAIVVSCHNVTIEYMEIKGWGLNSSSRAGFNCVINNSANFTARYNIIHDAYNANGGPAILIWDRGQTIHHNIIYDSLANASLSYGIKSYSPHGFSDPYIYNNTFYIPVGIVLFQQDYPINVGTIKNNVFYGGTINNWSPSVGQITNNATNQSSLLGTNNILNITSGVFNSIVVPFDLRLSTTSSVIGYGVNVGSPYNTDITSQSFNSAYAWDIGAHQLTIASTIGTSGRDYSTISSWNASCPSDLTTAGVDHNWNGYCYADSPFTDSIYLNTITDLNHSILLTAPIGQRHNGTAYGGGVVINRGGANGTVIYKNAATNAVISWLRITNYKDDGSNGYGIYGDNLNVSNCIIHDAAWDHSVSVDGYLGGVGGYTVSVNNCIIYNILGSTSHSVYGIWADGAGSSLNNNTIYNIVNTPGWWGSGNGAKGIMYQNNLAPASIKNNISMNGQSDFLFFSYGGSANCSNNMSSDGTAPGTNSLINKIVSNQFVSISAGSIDLHLKTGSNAIKQGVNLGAGYNIDIDGFDRISSTYKWDMGAHQYTKTLLKLLRGPLFLLLKGSDAI